MPPKRPLMLHWPSEKEGKGLDDGGAAPSSSSNLSSDSSSDSDCVVISAPTLGAAKRRQPAAAGGGGGGRVVPPAAGESSSKDIVRVSARPSSTVVPTNPSPETGNALWTVKYSPPSVSSLVVHKDKVSSLRRWLETAVCPAVRAPPGSALPPKLLVLSGPPGVGKSASVLVLARELGIRILQWTDDYSSAGRAAGYQNQSSSNSYYSSMPVVRAPTQLEDFKDFLDGCCLGGSALTLSSSSSSSSSSSASASASATRLAFVTAITSATIAATAAAAAAGAATTTTTAAAAAAAACGHPQPCNYFSKTLFFACIFCCSQTFCELFFQVLC